MNFEINQKNKGDGRLLLAQVDDASTRLVFFDPQYRGVLDRQKYGNEGEAGSRQKARSGLRQMTPRTIRFFGDEIGRALKPSGHLMLWLDKFSLGEGAWKEWVPLDVVKLVDVIHWNKVKTGMGRRSRARSEYLLVLQKPPIRAKGIWTDHRIDDSWLEQVSRSTHPHSKPIQLIRRLIAATTKPGDLVVDPAAGGYGVLEACRSAGRNFLGCDITTEIDA